MGKIANFICKKKSLIIVISAILLILSFIGMTLTKVNYDILIYLPDEIETVQGQNILTNDFNMGSYSIAVVENMPAKDIILLEKSIKEVDGVANVISVYDLIGEGIPIEMFPNKIKNKIHKDDTDLLFITFTESTSNEKTIEAVGNIRKITASRAAQSGMSSVILDTMELSEKEITVYIIIAVVLCIIVLQLSLDSYIVPFILLANIGAAILFNLGTNIFLGQISYITKALVAVLQLGVTTDFSIFLYHSYEEKKHIYKTREEAMSYAIKDTFLSVTGSSLTTIVGFLALCAMKLTLGRDLGIVMAKGVLLGVVTVLTLFPSLLLVFDKIINKTKHKDLVPSFNKFNNFTIKHYKIIFIIFITLLIPFYLANKKVDVYYKLDSSLPDTLEGIRANKILKEKYNIASPEIVIIDNKLLDDQVLEMTSKIRDLDGIDFVLSLREIKKNGLTEDILPSDLSNIFISDKYEIIIINSIYDNATIELNKELDEVNKIVKSYDKKGIVVGQGALIKDLVETYDIDYNNVNIYSIGCIFIVLLFVLKSFILPILLIITIEFAIFMNLGLSYFSGTILPFIAPITLGTIQLGATIDYAILLTTNYISKRRTGLSSEEAIKETMNLTTPSILISGMCFFAATFGVGIYSDIAMIGSICALISRGALISVLIVIMVLPSILIIFDKIIFNKKKRGINMIKLSKKITLWLILIGISVISLPLNTLALTKNEYVYGKLNYDGSKKSIIVNEQLINNEKLDTIEDYSELKDILNIKNDAKYTLSENNITWNALGNDIFYKGTTDKELPISVNITYSLDGKKYNNVKDMLGKKGHVTINLKYTNHDKHGNLYTPFIVALGTIIDGENNHNVNIINGKAINNGTNYIVVGLATPGLYESLLIDELSSMDKITISYDTDKFELSSMYSVITSKLIDNSDLSIFNKLDSLYSNINTLQEGMNQIEDGSKKLNDGINTLSTNINSVLNNDKVKKLRELLPTLEEDANKLKEITNNHSENINNFINNSNTAVDNVTNDILNILTYLNSIDEYISNVDNYSAIINGTTNNINNSLDSVSLLLDNIKTYLDKIEELTTFANSSADYIIKTYEANPEDASPELTELYNASIKIKNSNKLNEINTSLDNDKEKINELKNNISLTEAKVLEISTKLQSEEVINNINNIRKKCINIENIEEKVKISNENIHNNINKINDVVDLINNLPDNINKVSTGIDNLEVGVNELTKGSNELTEGISKFNKEGINKLTSLVNSDVSSKVAKLKELINLGNNYSSFAGTNNISSNTKFIMIVDSLNNTKEKTSKEETKKISLFDRIKNLFK